MEQLLVLGESWLNNAGPQLVNETANLLNSSIAAGLNAVEKCQAPLGLAKEANTLLQVFLDANMTVAPSMLLLIASPSSGLRPIALSSIGTIVAHGQYEFFLVVI